MNPRLTMVLPAEFLGSRDFLLRFKTETTSLAECMKRTGVVVPLFAVKRKDGKFELISGFRRLGAAKEAGFDEVPVLFLDEGEADRKSLFLIALLLREPSGVTELDNAVAIRKAHDVFGLNWREIQAGFTMSALPVSPKVLEEYARLARMPEEFLEKVDRGEIPFKGARALIHLNAEDRVFFVKEVLGKYELSASEIAIAIDWGLDMSRQSGKSVSDVLREAEPVFICSSGKRTAFGRKTKLMEALRKKRFPRLVGAEAARRKLKGAVEKKDRVLLESSPNLEENALSLTLKFSSVDELKKEIQSVLEKEILFKDLFHLVQ